MVDVGVALLLSLLVPLLLPLFLSLLPFVVVTVIAFIVTVFRLSLLPFVIVCFSCLLLFFVVCCCLLLFLSALLSLLSVLLLLLLLVLLLVLLVVLVVVVDVPVVLRIVLVHGPARSCLHSTVQHGTYINIITVSAQRQCRHRRRECPPRSCPSGMHRTAAENIQTVDMARLLIVSYLGEITAV